ncbi:hypothetical protein Tco_1554007 [Tanacetum coccineum]
MSSATSDVTYTSVYTDSEPGRAFWGADDEEISEGGIPRVIVLGYDGLPLQPVAPPSPDFIPGPEDPQTPPVPQDEDEREPMFIQAHDPDYVPEPIYPEYRPLEGDHEFPAEEQPLPPIDSPTTDLNFVRTSSSAGVNHLIPNPSDKYLKRSSGRDFRKHRVWGALSCECCTGLLENCYGECPRVAIQRYFIVVESHNLEVCPHPTLLEHTSQIKPHTLPLVDEIAVQGQFSFFDIQVTRFITKETVSLRCAF